MIKSLGVAEAESICQSAKTLRWLASSVGLSINLILWTLPASLRNLKRHLPRALRFTRQALFQQVTEQSVLAF
jgi:hypothetical protein